MGELLAMQLARTARISTQGLNGHKKGYSCLCLHPVSHLTFQGWKHGLLFGFFSIYLPCPWSCVGYGKEIQTTWKLQSTP